MNTKLTRNDFIEKVRENPVAVDYRTDYVVVKANSENIAMSEKFKEQLVDEGKYDNTYISFFTNEGDAPYSMDNLPIYGRSDKYETKHFSSSVEQAVMVDLKSKGMDLLNRYNEHQASL